MDNIWGYIIKGKKNDHVFHNACLAYLIKFYDKERDDTRLPKIGHNIMYSDNCPAQYKCRQNLFMIVTSADNNGSCQVHKFAQKFCFKGSWDATGKLIKSAILKNEMKHDRCANAYDCYLKLTRDITKNRQEDVNKNWLRWERNLDQKIQQKKVLKTN